MTGGRLRLEGAPPHSRAIAQFVAAVARRAGLARGQAYRLRLAADELTTNIAVHGYRLGKGVIELSSCVADDLVRLRIEDEAPPFDPRSHDPQPRLAAGPANGVPGGYGLFLALRSLDQFAYEYVGGHNRSTLGIRR
jgi:serine/threonine-protein kinase RsbW